MNIPFDNINELFNLLSKVYLFGLISGCSISFGLALMLFYRKIVKKTTEEEEWE